MDMLGLLNKMESHAAATGHFDRVNTFEPKSAPGSGVTCAIWADRIRPAKSGLSATSVRINWTIRIYTSMTSEPADSIDPNLLSAVDVLMEAYTGNFTLDGTIRSVDLLGIEGEPMEAKAGYIEQDRKLFRVVDINLPVIVNDIWTEVS